MTDNTEQVSTDIMPQQSATKACFMKVPVEIRFQIYAELLCLPSFIGSVVVHESRVSAAILLTCRRINSEATGFLYSNNMFIAHPSLLADFPRLREWYPPICTLSVLPQISRFHLTIRLVCDLRFDQSSAAAAFSGSKELYVWIVQAVFMGAGHDNLRTLEDVRGVKKLTIRGSTSGFEDYVIWLAQLMRSPLGTETDRFIRPKNHSL
ncbi:hypothetical protein ARSEF1564_009118 [Beauveria bassiana]